MCSFCWDFDNRCGWSCCRFCRNSRVAGGGRWGGDEVCDAEGEEAVELFLDGEGGEEVARGLRRARAGGLLARTGGDGERLEQGQGGVALDLEELPGGGEEAAEGVDGEEEVGLAQLGEVGRELVALVGEPRADGALGDAEFVGDVADADALAVALPGEGAQEAGVARGGGAMEELLEAGGDFGAGGFVVGEVVVGGGEGGVE
jgi:hypothetical protein